MFWKNIFIIICIILLSLTLNAENKKSPYLLDLKQSFASFTQSISFENKSIEERWQLMDRIIAYSFVVDKCNDLYPLYTPLKKSKFIMKNFLIQVSHNASGLMDYDLSLRKETIKNDIGRIINKILQPHIRIVCRNVSSFKDFSEEELEEDFSEEELEEYVVEEELEENVVIE